MTNQERQELREIIDENCRDSEAFGKWYSELNNDHANIIGFCGGMAFYARHSEDPEVVQLKKLIHELKGKLIDYGLLLQCEPEDSPGVDVEDLR
jgi:hypothetical protein